MGHYGPLRSGAPGKSFMVRKGNRVFLASVLAVRRDPHVGCEVLSYVGMQR